MIHVISKVGITFKSQAKSITTYTKGTSKIPVVVDGFQLSTSIGLPSAAFIDSDLLHEYLQNVSENVALLYNSTTKEVTLFVRM